MPLRLIGREQRRAGLDDLADSCLYLAGQSPIRSYRIKLGKLRLQKEQQNKNDRHKKGFAVLSADLQNRRHVPPPLQVVPIDNAQHSDDKKPLEPGQALYNGAALHQALRHNHKAQQITDGPYPLLVNGKDTVPAVCNLQKLPALFDNILGRVDLPPDRRLCIGPAGVAVKHWRSSFRRLESEAPDQLPFCAWPDSAFQSLPAPGATGRARRYTGTDPWSIYPWRS